MVEGLVSGFDPSSITVWCVMAAATGAASRESEESDAGVPVPAASSVNRGVGGSVVVGVVLRGHGVVGMRMAWSSPTLMVRVLVATTPDPK